jgi:hypothetical protein
MTPEQYVSLAESNDQYESEHQSFCATCIFGIIAANWVFLSEQDLPAIVASACVTSVVLAVLFLLLRTLRQFLNIRHNRKILNDCAKAEERKLPQPHPDASCERTIYGQVSSVLYPLEPVFLALCAIWFIFAAFKFWLFVRTPAQFPNI